MIRLGLAISFLAGLGFCSLGELQAAEARPARPTSAEVVGTVVPTRQSQNAAASCVYGRTSSAAPAALTLAGSPSFAERPVARAAALRVEARPVSTDGRPVWNAIRLRLQTVTADGRPVPVRGQLRVELWSLEQEEADVGEQWFAFDRTGRPRRFVALRRPRVRRLAQWTRWLEPPGSDAAASSAGAGRTPESLSAGRRCEHTDQPVPTVVVLPLPRPLPSTQPGLAPLGSLSVSLLVPGVGLLHTPPFDVPLKPRRTLAGRRVGFRPAGAAR